MPELVYVLLPVVGRNYEPLIQSLSSVIVYTASCFHIDVNSQAINQRGQLLTRLVVSNHASDVALQFGWRCGPLSQGGSH